MNGPNEKQEKIIWQAVSGLSLLVLLGLGLGLFILLMQGVLFLKSVLMPLAIAGVLAYLLHPLVCWLEQRGLKRIYAIVVLFVVLGLTVLGSLAFVVPQLYGELSSLVREMPRISQELQDKTLSWLHERPEVAEALQKTLASIETEWPKYQNQIASWLWSGLSSFLSTLGFMLGLVFIPLYVFYFLRDQPEIERSWQKYIPLQRCWWRDEVVIIIREINKHMITFFRGQVIVAMILGVLTGMGLGLIGLEYALLIGLISALFSIIPYLGVIISIAPALLVASTQSGGDLGFIALTAGVFAVVQFLEGSFISPKIMGDRTGLHPLTIIVSILVWSLLLGGLLGAILAIPLTATLKVLMYRYIWLGELESGTEGAEAERNDGDKVET
ncbi:MAG: AI-2E family transporter [Blastochloris sp.]|nr:AI-2E family transporter [Blastochloris sp.]